MEQVNRLLTAALTNRPLEKVIEIKKEDDCVDVKTFYDFQLVKTAILTVAIVLYKMTKIACLVVNKRVYFWRQDGKNQSQQTFSASYENFFYRAEYPALANLVYTCFYQGYIKKWLFHVKKPFSIYHVFADTLIIFGHPTYVGGTNLEKFRRCLELFKKEEDEDRYTSWEICNIPSWDYITDNKSIEMYDNMLQDQKEMWDMIVEQGDYSCLEQIRFRDLPYMLFCHALNSSDKKLEKYCLDRWSCTYDSSRLAHIRSFFVV